MLDTNDPAPDFTLPGNNATNIQLLQFRGKHVVLFFYPRDDTSGCTRECLNFSEAKETFDKKDTVVIGISKDSVASHDKFIAKHQLTIPLLSDENSTTCENYGVWKEKNMYGKKYMGIERSTFLIGRDGKIVKVWRKVKVPGHVADVLSTL